MHGRSYHAMYGWKLIPPGQGDIFGTSPYFQKYYTDAGHQKVDMGLLIKGSGKKNQRYPAMLLSRMIPSLPTLKMLLHHKVLILQG